MSLEQHRELRDKLALILSQNNGGPVSCPVSLGAGTSIEAIVDNTERVTMALTPSDVWVELEVPKAIAFLDRRLVQLEAEAKVKEEQAAALKGVLAKALQKIADDQSTAAA